MIERPDFIAHFHHDRSSQKAPARALLPRLRFLVPSRPMVRPFRFIQIDESARHSSVFTFISAWYLLIFRFSSSRESLSERERESLGPDSKKEWNEMLNRFKYIYKKEPQLFDKTIHQRPVFLFYYYYFIAPHLLWEENKTNKKKNNCIDFK